MERILPLLIGLFLASTSAFSQIRNIDGSNNNLQNPDWGATHTQLNRVTSIGYSDGISAPGGTTRPNPRTISNTIFAQDILINDPRNLSDFIWVFGQFIDHDITLVEESNEPAFIPVPTGDPWFDPFGQGTALIFMTRSVPMFGTGTDPSNPREHPNAITAWIDGSSVYGSDLDRANWLRTFEGGKMKTSTNNLLPFNTLNSNYATPIDPAAPDMADAVQISNYHFVAGDVRANENPLLIGFHTLFVREHNRLCDTLAVLHPDWSDEDLYQHARRWVSGLIQSVVYNEWLPTMGIDLPPYSGYDETVNPNISNVFSAAAFRMGHTLLNSVIQRLDSDGNEIPAGNLVLQDAFFNPLSIIWSGGGLDPLFRGMATQIQQDMDCKVIDDVRNFLFGAPGAGGLDLAAININRGRERGLPDFNTVRTDFGLSAYTSFAELNADPDVAASMAQLYGNIDDIDPWVGMLAEQHMPEALFGETIMKIMEEQFFVLREGDRFYFENDPVLSAEEKYEIKNTTLRSIIMRNTNIKLMQSNVFQAMDHDDICNPNFDFYNSNPDLAIEGLIESETQDRINNVVVQFDTLAFTVMSGANGAFPVPLYGNCSEHTITLNKEEDYLNGVTTYDMVLIRKHILSTELLDSPYKMIAADVNQSGTITTFDMVEIRKLILGSITEFESSPSWRFFHRDFSFDDPQNPFASNIPNNTYTYSLNAPDESLPSFDFLGIKIGDVNESAATDLTANVDTRDLEQSIILQTKDSKFKAGETVVLDLQMQEEAILQGFQFTLNFDMDVLEMIDFQGVNLGYFSENNYLVFENKGAVTTSWDGNVIFEENENVFKITFEAKRNGQLSDLLSINSRITKAEAYSSENKILGVDLQFQDENENAFLSEKMELYQNEPNPFNATTKIGFFLTEASDVQIAVFDLSGKELKTINGFFEKGIQQVAIDGNDLAGKGILYYQLKTAFGTLTKKMVLVK